MERQTRIAPYVVFLPRLRRKLGEKRRNNGGSAMNQNHECAIVKALVAADLESCLITLSQKYPRWWDLPCAQDKTNEILEKSTCELDKIPGDKQQLLNKTTTSRIEKAAANKSTVTKKVKEGKINLKAKQEHQIIQPKKQSVYYTIPFPKSPPPEEEPTQEFVNIIEVANTLLRSDLYNRL